MKALQNDVARHQRVIEGADRILRRTLAAIDSSVLKKKYTNAVDVADLSYKPCHLLQHHDLDATPDRGYIEFYDIYHDRYIYVTSKEVGKSKLFHIDKEIRSIVNVIYPCSSHEHSTYMSKHVKTWFVTNVEYVCLQMFDTIGNIVIFCNTGRSRSPMYLVAYINLFYGMDIDNAKQKVENLMHKERQQILDRHYTLFEIVAAVSEIVPRF